MGDEAKRWWEMHGRSYQETCQIPIDVLYGTGSPNEEELQLIGPVSGQRVLELGCGGAQCSIAFAKQGATVIAVDIAASEIEFAKELAGRNKVAIEFHQRDVADLAPIASSSQNIVFSAFAFNYVDDLLSSFKEVYRVLKDGGIFVWSVGHPFAHSIDSETLRLNRSYFETGKSVVGEETGCAFASVHRTVSDYCNLLVEAGFLVEQMIEPDSRRRYPYDPWFGLWGNTQERLRMFPATLIFKGKKLSCDLHHTDSKDN
ncbi:MAG: methyltransferase domain-containing protein [Pyrinomonadaceae bacterium]|nr:methyltransferase domain-containing protein [Pyrinomonadaceae bacterium]MDQ3133771.1 methyltransferase domain-containing protein [Acidobacteriota bacterium]